MRKILPVFPAGVILAAFFAGGCTALGERAWVPQGPAGTLQDSRSTQTTQEAQAAAKTAAPAPAAAPPAASSRRLDVSPELVAQSAPPPSPRPAAPVVAATGEVALGGYTQATRYGDLVFISGQIPMDFRTNRVVESPSIEEQTRVAMENLRTVLESHRLTMANVVATTVYLKNINDFAGMDKVYDGFFKGTPPSRSVVEVARLPRGVLVEISAIAGR